MIFSMSMSCRGGICFNLDINFSVGSFNISYKFYVIHILRLNIPFPSTFLFIQSSLVFSFVFCFKAEMKLGETLSFVVNTKVSLAKAMKFCKIHSRLFESQCTKRCPNLLNILVSGSTLAPGTEFYTAFSLHQENPCSSTYKSGASETVKWSICELLATQFGVSLQLTNSGWFSQYFFL